MLTSVWPPIFHRRHIRTPESKEYSASGQETLELLVTLRKYTPGAPTTPNDHSRPLKDGNQLGPPGLSEGGEDSPNHPTQTCDARPAPQVPHPPVTKTLRDEKI